MNETMLLTQRQQALLNYIIEYKRGHDGLAPTMREMCKTRIVTSTSLASYYLRILAAAGKIRLLPGSRGIIVVGGQWRME